MTRIVHAVLLLLTLTAAGGCDSGNESKSTSAGDEKTDAAFFDEE